MALSVSQHTQRHAMMFPRRQIVRAVHGYATALNLTFDLVLAKQEELSRFLFDRNGTGMRVYEISLRVPPSRSGDNPFRRYCGRS
jgi:hypothetical protein